MSLPEFLAIMNGDLQNEWTHLQFYLYHAAAVTGPHAATYRKFFADAAAGELTHVQQFTERLLGLNYKQPATSGKSFPIFTHPADILAHAALLETEVVNNYAARLEMLDTIAAAHPATAAYLKTFYEQQLADSYEDAEHMRRMVSEF